MPRGDPSAHLGYSMSPTRQSIFDDAEEALRPPSAASSFDTRNQSPLPQDEEDDGDDGGISFISAPTPKPAFHRGADPLRALDSEQSFPTEEGEEDPRLSMLGPKMRFVSRAPWETGEDDLIEDDEDDVGGTGDSHSIFGSKMSTWRGRDQDKSSTKGLGLSNFRSRSPGPSSATGRKGGIGMNFGLHRHKTPESQREGPYDPYLSGASQSHNAILYVSIDPAARYNAHLALLPEVHWPRLPDPPIL